MVLIIASFYVASQRSGGYFHQKNKREVKKMIKTVSRATFHMIEFFIQRLTGVLGRKKIANWTNSNNWIFNRLMFLHL